MSIKSKVDEEKQLFQVIGNNTRLARNLSGMTRAQLMDLVWSYSNNQKFANRVSELEGGEKRIELITFYRICKALDVSADYLLGLSEDYERDNLESKVSGRIFQSIRSTVLESTDQICMNVAKSIRHLPPYQGELLKSKARAVCDTFDRYSHDLVFQGQYKELLEAISEMKSAAADFDKYFARQMRQIEMSMMTMLEDPDEFSNKRLNMSLIEPEEKPANLNNISQIVAAKKAEQQRNAENKKTDHKNEQCGLESKNLSELEDHQKETEESAAEVKVYDSNLWRHGRYEDKTVWRRVKTLYEANFSYSDIKKKVSKEFNLTSFPSQRSIGRRVSSQKWVRQGG